MWKAYLYTQVGRSVYKELRWRIAYYVLHTLSVSMGLLVHNHRG